MAFRRPPGASHFHTSPKPPRPSGSRSLYPGNGSLPTSFVKGRYEALSVCAGGMGGPGTGPVSGRVHLDSRPETTEVSENPAVSTARLRGRRRIEADRDRPCAPQLSL